MSTQPIAIQSTKVSSKLSELSNHFRSHRGEAILRIRSNTFGLCLIFLSTWLLPIPTLSAAFRTVTTEYSKEGSPLDWALRIFCLLEVALTAILSYNLLEAFYAVKYPRTPLPPAVTSPVKKQGLVVSPSPAKRPFSIISPNATPSKKIFSYSPMKSMSQSQSSVQLGGGSSKYPVSPVTTPSRVIRYSMPASSSAATNISSTSTLPPTPSPVVSAYRGKHATSNVGRPLDGLFLSQIAGDEELEGDE